MGAPLYVMDSSPLQVFFDVFSIRTFGEQGEQIFVREVWSLEEDHDLILSAFLIFDSALDRDISAKLYT